jgi:hypothetical protein
LPVRDGPEELCWVGGPDHLPPSVAARFQHPNTPIQPTPMSDRAAWSNSPTQCARRSCLLNCIPNYLETYRNLVLGAHTTKPPPPPTPPTGSATGAHILVVICDITRAKMKRLIDGAKGFCNRARIIGLVADCWISRVNALTRVSSASIIPLSPWTWQ